MAKTKIRMSPIQENSVQLILEVEEISKEDVIEVDNSYLFEVKKVSKSGNELSFTIFFHKRFFMKKVVKEGNPKIAMYSANKLLTIQIISIFNESEIRQNGTYYSFEKEAAGDITFTIKFNVSEEYFRRKVLENK